MGNCRDVDRLVTPYLDGEAAPEETASVASHVGKCSPCRDRVHAEQTAREVLRARAGSLRVDAPAGLVERCTAASRGQGPVAPKRRLPAWMPLSLAATLVLAIGGAFAWGLYRPVPAVATELTADHISCFSSPGRAVVRTPDEVARLESALSQACGRPIRVLPGDEALGLRLVTARRCRTSDGPIAHLMYDHQGTPLSIFVLLDGARPSRQFAVMGHEAFLWSGPGVTYAMIGGESARDLEPVAAYAKAALASGR